MINLLLLDCFDYYVFMCLALLLFWRQRKLNIFIMFHIVVVLALFYRAMEFSASDFATITPTEQATTEFHRIVGAVQDGLIPFFVIWIYEWYYIGRRRSELGYAFDE